jgi:polyhydroxybutyrate depolymerase
MDDKKMNSGRLKILLFTLILVLAAAVSDAPAASPKKDRFFFITHGGERRSYLVHLPPVYNGKKALPLVLVLHGGGGEAEGMARITRFSDMADRKGFIAVYPNGTGILSGQLLTWNAGNCCGLALDLGTDDVGFLRVLLEKLKKDFSIDPKRIYVTGLSNGGMMSYRLACELSGEIAAIAPVAGAMNTECHPAKPVSVIIFHGTEDGHVRYDGGAPLVQADWHPRTDRPVRETASLWAKFNGCDPKAQTSIQGNVSIDRYGGCREGTEVVLYTIRGEGHTWPGGEPWAPWASVPTSEISATDLIWKFFFAHPKYH